MEGWGGEEGDDGLAVCGVRGVGGVGWIVGVVILVLVLILILIVGSVWGGGVVPGGVEGVRYIFWEGCCCGGGGGGWIKQIPLLRAKLSFPFRTG